jgi:hypothetical protein
MGYRPIGAASDRIAKELCDVKELCDAKSYTRFARVRMTVNAPESAPLTP